MSRLGLVVRNFLALGGGEAAGRLIAFAAMIHAARAVGVDGFGVIGFSIALMLYGAALADFGVETIGTQKIASKREALIPVASAVLTARVLFGVVLAGVVSFGARELLWERDAQVLSIHALAIIPLAASTKWVHLGLESTRPIGVARILGDATTAAMIFGAVRGPDDLAVVPIAFVVGETVASTVQYAALLLRGVRLRPRWSTEIAGPIAKQALPIVGHSMLGLLIYNSDTVMLRWFEGETAVGYYNAAYQLISFLLNLGVAYGFSLLPTLTRAGAGTDEERGLYHHSLALVTAATVPVALGGFFFATPILTTFFGEPFGPSGVALALLIWSIPFSLARNVAIAALMARERPDQMFKTTVYAALLNLGLNFLLIPRYGLPGAAVATVATEALRTGLAVRYVGLESLAPAPWSRYWRAASSGVAMLAVLYLVAPASIFWGIPLGGAVYVAGLFATGGLAFENGRPAVRV